MKIVVNPKTQIAKLVVWLCIPVKKYIISTAKLGLGCAAGSNQTPPGNFVIDEKIGEGEKPGTVFVGRKPTGEVWTSNPENPLNQGENKSKGFVLTRILRLAGLDSANKNTKDRFIYFHGTRFEEKLGTPNSEGCITMKNSDIIDIFNRISQGTKVKILNKEYNSKKAVKAQRRVLQQS